MFIAARSASGSVGAATEVDWFSDEMMVFKRAILQRMTWVRSGELWRPAVVSGEPRCYRPELADRRALHQGSAAPRR